MPVYQGGQIVPVYEGDTLITPPLDFATGLSSPSSIAFIQNQYVIVDDGDTFYFYDVLGRAIVDKVFDLGTGDRYWGLAADDDYLYAKNRNDADLLRIDPSDGQILNTYRQSPNRPIQGLTFNGENLVGIEAGTANLVTISRTGDEISRVRAQGISNNAQGIAFANNLYWIIELSRTVTALDVTGARQGGFTWPSPRPHPSNRPSGITWDKQFLRIVEANADRIATFKLDGTWMGGITSE